MQTLAAMNGLGLNPLRLPPILPPTQTRITGTSEQGLNLETLLGGSHSMANREPPETQEMCFPTTTLLWRQRSDSEEDPKSDFLSTETWVENDL